MGNGDQRARSSALSMRTRHATRSRTAPLECTSMLTRCSRTTAAAAGAVSRTLAASEAQHLRIVLLGQGVEVAQAHVPFARRVLALADVEAAVIAQLVLRVVDDDGGLQQAGGAVGLDAAWQRLHLPAGGEGQLERHFVAVAERQDDRGAPRRRRQRERLRQRPERTAGREGDLVAEHLLVALRHLPGENELPGVGGSGDLDGFDLEAGQLLAEPGLAGFLPLAGIAG